MGRHQFGGHQNFKVVVGNEGQRRTYSQHDDRGGEGPRRGGGGGSRNLVWRKEDHDGGPNKRVSFHNDRRGGAIRKRGGIRGRLGGPPLNVIIEQDEAGSYGNERSSQAGRARPVPGGVRGKYSSRSRGRGRGGATYIVPSNLVTRRVLPNGTGGGSNLCWNKITVENSSKYPKEDVCEAIMNAYKTVAGDLVRNPFLPICFSKHGMNYVFFVETEAVADTLVKLSRNIYMYGHQDKLLSLRVERSPPPRVNPTDEVWEKAKLVMSSRYTPATKALDLKSFHTDPIFLQEAVFVPLSRGIILKKIVQIIEENIPEVEAIDLSDNRLNTLDQLASLFNKAKYLKILYLANNKIDDPSELKTLKGLQLIDFKLEGNSVVARLEDNYTRIIRKLFPSLVILDGAELPKLITFEDDGPGGSASSRQPDLPPIQMKLICNEEAGKIVLQFLEEYFRVYDSDNRQALIDAYHENAVMSLSASYPPSYQSSSVSGMKEYTVQSRNLCRVNDPMRRQKLLHQGRLSIFAFLKDLPKTLHDPSSFTLDLPFATERLMAFSVTGVFKEREAGDDTAVRHFNRMFIVVPQGSGFCIVNETLFVTTATTTQIKTYFKGPIVGMGQPVAAALPDGHVMTALVESLSQKTKMNAFWSRKCLEETGWDLAKAEIAFRNASNEGKIPIEAFES